MMAVDDMLQTFKIQIAELNRSRGASESGCTIFRVPQHVKRGREHLFHPRTVSIGPYHHGDPEFADMEKVKVQFLNELLPTEPELRSCISELKKVEEKARRCYFHSPKLGSEEFVQILLKDGCFIIQFLLILKKLKSTSGGVCGRRWIQDMIIHDLLLLENQIPFFVLQNFYSYFSRVNPGLFAGSFGKHFTLIELIDQLFLSTSPRKYMPTKEHNRMEYYHLVHLYHHWICSPVQQSHISRWSLTDMLKYLNLIKLISTFFSFILVGVQKKLDRSSRDPPRSIPSATRLSEAGMEFRKKKPSGSGLFDVSFNKADGVLEIPPITLSREMNCILANLVAFEQCTGDEDQPVSSYAIVMDHLVDTPEDAELLVRKGILERMIPSNEEVALFFNQLSNSCHHLNDDNHKFKAMFEGIDDYNRIFWHAWRAKLVRGYFSNPWSVISLLAAVLLLTLTLAQTILSVLTYINDQDKPKTGH